MEGYQVGLESMQPHGPQRQPSSLCSPHPGTGEFGNGLESLQPQGPQRQPSWIYSVSRSIPQTRTQSHPLVISGFGICDRLGAMRPKGHRGRQVGTYPSLSGTGKAKAKTRVPPRNALWCLRAWKRATQRLQRQARLSGLIPIRNPAAGRSRVGTTLPHGRVGGPPT